MQCAYLLNNEKCIRIFGWYRGSDRCFIYITMKPSPPPPSPPPIATQTCAYILIFIIWLIIHFQCLRRMCSQFLIKMCYKTVNRKP